MIQNAIIKNTFLGFDYPLFTFELSLDIQDGTGCCFGGMALDEYDKWEKKRIVTQRGGEAIQRILEVVGVDSWEELKGKYVRVETKGLTQPIKKIGNIMKDEWVDFSTFFIGGINEYKN